MQPKSLTMRLIGVLLFVGVNVFPNSAKSVGGQCDRACLNGLVDQYLAALVTHDPFSLPLAENVRYTENGQTLELGDGMWGPASGLGSYKFIFADPEAGQVGFFGVFEEFDRPVILALRLKVEKNKITEIEYVVARCIG